MKIKVNKTTYKVEEIDTMEGNEMEYTIYRLLNKNTKKTLIHNITENTFTLMGGTIYRTTMTTPDTVDIL